MYEDILNKKKKIALIGLGYVGLPIALAFARKVPVIGFDINEERVGLMRQQIDPSKELDKKAFEGTDIHFTADIEDLKEANFYIIAVPTPIDASKTPNLKPLLSASETVGKVLKKGDYVVYESTVYPGCTEEDCIPILERLSGLKFQKDFKVGYSPERINPGDLVHRLETIIKVVSGSDQEATDNIAKVYELVVDAGVHKASSIKVAEAAKVIENTQRDLNIALMNELSQIFDLMNINTFEVIEAAGTKWNFLKFTPGLVGGHCIGVDPYYLTYKANKLGYNPRIILSGRKTNDSVGAYIANQTIKKVLKHQSVNLTEIRVLVMGVTFKENVSDIRNSKVVDVVNELKDFNVNVDVIDTYANSEEVKEEYGFELVENTRDDYNAVIVAVTHNPYLALTEDDYFSKLTVDEGLFVDVKGAFKNKINTLNYWSL